MYCNDGAGSWASARSRAVSRSAAVLLSVLPGPQQAVQRFPARAVPQSTDLDPLSVKTPRLLPALPIAAGSLRGVTMPGARRTARPLVQARSFGVRNGWVAGPGAARHSTP